MEYLLHKHILHELYSQGTLAHSSRTKDHNLELFERHDGDSNCTNKSNNKLRCVGRCG